MTIDPQGTAEHTVVIKFDDSEFEFKFSCTHVVAGELILRLVAGTAKTLGLDPQATIDSLLQSMEDNKNV
jgi:hypothetical protein